jgi:hypothetical protein
MMDSMNKCSRTRIAAIAIIGLTIGVSYPSYPQTHAPAAASVQKEASMTTHASGPFEVKLVPQKDQDAAPSIGRMTLNKQFHGDLEGTSAGQMLTAGSAEKSGAYVAIEKVTGTLKGRSGTFVLQHSGTMTRGTPQLSITVVPDSGTGQLTGLAGKMTINIAPDGKHSYDFEYSLPSDK